MAVDDETGENSSYKLFCARFLSAKKLVIGGDTFGVVLLLPKLRHICYIPLVRLSPASFSFSRIRHF
jgi:hypothetical protein